MAMLIAMVQDPLLEKESEFVQRDVTVEDKMKLNAEFGASVDGFEGKVDSFSSEYLGQIGPEDPSDDFHKCAENEGGHYETYEEGHWDENYNYGY